MQKGKLLLKAATDLKEEMWKDVIGLEETYEVSSLGRLRNKKTNTFMVGGNVGNARGYYLRYNMAYDNKRVSILAHRLVATHFIPNPDNQPIVHHKDNNKKNNAVENLEWVSASTNVKLAYIDGMRGVDVRQRPVLQYSLNNELIEKHDSIAKASRKSNVGTTNIRMCCNGEIKKAGGFIWKYAPREEDKFIDKNWQEIFGKMPMEITMGAKRWFMYYYNSPTLKQLQNEQK